MSIIEQIKKDFLEAAQEADLPQSRFHDTARTIVNIERQSYYGEESSNKRLGRMREVLSEAVKREKSDEA